MTSEVAAAEARCRSCGLPFAYDADFYATRGLSPPARCRPCRAERRARLVTVLAIVERVEPSYIFAKAGTDHYFIGPATVASDLGALRVGDTVALDVDPLAPVEPGRRPRALRGRRQ